VGLYSYDKALNLMYYGTGNRRRGTRRSARRQQVVDDHLRA